MPRRYVIIGSGVAGVSAAEIIQRQDPSGHLTLVSDDPYGYYSRPGLAYFLSRTIPEWQLFPHRKTDRDSHLGVNWVQARVVKIDPAGHALTLDAGQQIRFDRLLIATGSRAAPGDFPGNDVDGVVTLYTLEDVRCMLQMVKRRKTAVVIGGGIIALELAEGLAANRVQVHYFLRGDRFWSKMLNETEARLVERGLVRMGMRIHYRTQVAQVLSLEGALSAVVTKAGETIPCQLLGIAIGVLPQMELAQGAGLATDRGILVNELLATSAADIFAAGDVAQVYDPRTGGTWMETLWATARRQGQVAGYNMTGEQVTVTRCVQFNAVRIGDIMTTIIGDIEQGENSGVLKLVASGRQNWQALFRAEDIIHADHVNHMRVLVGERTILGAVVMGDQTLAQLLLNMIQNEIDISSIRPSLAASPEQGIEEIIRFYMREHYSDVRD